MFLLSVKNKKEWCCRTNLDDETANSILFKIDRHEHKEHNAGARGIKMITSSRRAG